MGSHTTSGGGKSYTLRCLFVELRETQTVTGYGATVFR